MHPEQDMIDGTQKLYSGGRVIETRGQPVLRWHDDMKRTAGLGYIRSAVSIRNCRQVREAYPRYRPRGRLTKLA